MLRLFQEASTLPRVKSLCKTSNTAMKMPPSSSFPWVLILEHNVMWQGISLWPCISVPALPPKILPTCWEGRDRAPQPGTRQWEGHRKPQLWASGTSLGAVWGQAQLEPKSEPSSAWAKEWVQLSRAQAWGQGRAVGAGSQPCLSFKGPGAPADTSRGWSGVLAVGSGGRHWTGTLCPSTALEALTKVVYVGNFTLLLISITVWRTYIFLLLSKLASWLASKVPFLLL